jgi:hypothetical protein
MVEKMIGIIGKAGERKGIGGRKSNEEEEEGRKTEENRGEV